MDSPDRAEIKITLQSLLASRGPEKSICPSEVARCLADQQDWRRLMEPVRDVARELARQGEIVITQGGREVDPDDFKGPIRIRLASTSTDRTFVVSKAKPSR